MVFSFKNGKSPGPDKMTASFFKSYWHIVGAMVIETVQYFFLHGHLLKATNHIFISLIPETENAQAIDQYRPIALCNLSYKIITHIIASRLKKALSSIISPAQTTFIPERGMTDNITISTKSSTTLTGNG